MNYIILSFIFVDVKMFNITLTLERDENDQIREWWVVNQMERGPIIKNKFDKGLELYVFSDQVSPPSLGFLAGYGYVVILGDLKEKRKKKICPALVFQWNVCVLHFSHYPKLCDQWASRCLVIIHLIRMVIWVYTRYEKQSLR